MAVNTKSHAERVNEDLTHFWKLNPNELMRVHHVHNQQEQIIPEMYETYIISFIFQRSSLI
jgi:hypothetical protein